MTTNGDSWIELCELSSEIEAELLHGRLEAEGIDCNIESLKFHAEPVNLGALAEVRVHVRKADVERARELLADLEQQDARRAAGGDDAGTDDVDESDTDSEGLDGG